MKPGGVDYAELIPLSGDSRKSQLLKVPTPASSQLDGARGLTYIYGSIPFSKLILLRTST